MEPSDETLCERVGLGDHEAFDLLVERYRDRAYRLAWSIVRDVEDARDVSQEAFIRLHQAAGGFHGRARFSTWFYRMVVNLGLDHRRRHRWWRRVFDPASRSDDDDRTVERLPARDALPDEGAARSQTMSRVWAAVERLSPQQRAAVTLQVDGLSAAEIATVLGCSEATVRVHLHRALSTLRKTVGAR